MKVAIGCDHGGLDLKDIVKSVLKELGHDIDDQGCNSSESVDYPNFAKAVSSLVKNGECERGILICGTGIGMSMAANRIPGIRAALIPVLRFAAMDIPIPVPQIRIPRSHFPSLTIEPTALAKFG